MNWLALFNSISIVVAVALIFGRGEYDPQADYRWERMKRDIKRKIFGSSSDDCDGGYPF